MAIKPGTIWPTQTDVDPAYPWGKAKNVVTTNDGTGTPLERRWVNDLWGFLQALLDSAGITPSGNPDQVGTSDYLDAINTRIGTTKNLTARNWRLDYAVDMLTPLLMNPPLTIPYGFQLSRDGKALFVLDTGNATVHEYLLSTEWSLDSATHSASISLIGEVGQPRAIAFGSDGKSMFICDTLADLVHRYELGIAWSLSSALHDPITLSTIGEDPGVRKITLRDDGRKLYIIGGNGIVYQYDLPTAWSLVGASYDNLWKDVTAEQGLFATGITFSTDGSKFYMVESATKTVHGYSLSTYWKIDTATPDAAEFDFTATNISPQGIDFSISGGQLFILDLSADTIHEFATGRLIT